MNAIKVSAGLAAVSAAALLGYTGYKVVTPAVAVAADAAMPAMIPGIVKVDNFRLTDANLDSHELYRLKDASAVVIVTQGDGCPIVRNIAGTIKALKAKYAGKGVEFMMLNSNLQDNRVEAAAEAKEYGYDMPILMDQDQLVGEQLGVTRTAEVIVINPKTWKIIYRGPVDDRVTYERQKAQADNNWADDAIAAVVAGKTVEVAQRDPQGCIVNFPTREAKAKAAIQNISYSKTIAPLIQEKCVACHEPGGIGPMPLTSYEKIKGFAPMIRETIRTQRMPPWQADPTVGHFLGDKSLSDDQKKTLVHWIEAGAPRGAGEDPLSKVSFKAPDWPLGKPDVVLNVPAYTIPASGIVDYQRPYTANPETEGKWIRASTIKVDQRQAVHHILTGYVAQVPANGQVTEAQWGQSVGHYAVGAESDVLPKDVGSYLPAGGVIGFQNHYTPFGKQVTDNSQIGLYFYKDGQKPKMPMHTNVVIQSNIEIPANDGHHKEVAYLTFPHEALLYSAFIHAHYRADAAYVTLQYPDGKQEMLVALPHYDFNWQRDYYFKDPIKVPAGSKIITTYYYDNSKRNPGNPDPTKVVKWGEQSFEEMHYTQLEYRWIGETTDKQQPAYDKDLLATRLMGILDTNVDGKVEASELRGAMGAPIKAAFSVLDTNHDGFLDTAELAAGQAMMQQKRAQTASR
jgi:mono/diheme cytochrome c family protein